MPHDTFAPAQAVSALSSLGFKSSFGSLKLEKLGPEFFPLIAFARGGDAIVLHGPIEDGLVRISQFGSKGKIETSFIRYGDVKLLRIRNPRSRVE